MMVVVAMVVAIMRVRMPALVVVQAARAGAEIVAEGAFLDIGPRCRRPLALDMVVVALLGHADFGFESENLRPILAERAIHLVASFEYFRRPGGESGQDARMVA